MGSPEDEAGRTVTETRHHRRIDRSFAIATEEVTVAQYIRFLEDNPTAMNLPKREEVKISIPAPDCPMLTVDWYDAARYCNWLNRREGIPEAQWCYPAEFKPEMTLPSDYLSRTGYRLPTEAEWEHACRAGSLASRPYGSRAGLLGHYAWYAANSGIDRPTTTSHPVGHKKPNDLGLFDILGNAFEWIHDPYDRYPTEAEGKVILDAELGTHVSDSMMRVLRGGAFLYLATDLRSAARGRDRPTDRDVAGGLRPARTFPRVRRLPSASQRPRLEAGPAK
jgi:formylglycine-generating enzyme required for sulfatase activity